MSSIWKTDERIEAALDSNRYIDIPAGEVVEEAAAVEDDRVRIFWDRKPGGLAIEGLGGLTVRRSDLETKAHRIGELISGTAY